MKKKLLISIVLVIFLFTCTITIPGKQSELPEQASKNGPKEDHELFLYDHFQQLALKLYEKKGRVPQGILEILSGLGR